MNFKDLPDDIIKHVLLFLDYKCKMCLSYIPIDKRPITVYNSNFCSSSCCNYYFHNM